jgi:CRISPR/Cas system-associated exonuclease Cas4 (RecB family)
VLRVTDYKTGKAWTRDGLVVGGGETLQPLLYALAAERILPEPVESGRLYYCTTDGGYTERVVPLDAAGRATVTEVVAIIDRALQGTFLPAAPRKDACRFCDYRPVCGPLEETRTARKPPERLVDLLRLRSLP